ncbi:hypothetical protein EHEL_111955 [Encephalitozoon hellem ATCC 50504]|uniref:Uncharacterized protein n=1 Tax=Encephalitozoon hellem TaxID=27973 RepID=A0A9Q9CBC2_ENCHE|nr:uncharacterized protein EHEL_071785 [Encephalitozoon hellem ATCC 50504]XP_059599528.1 uncharacterized protein EHEL_100065 [Encephalitozoon hellem ATCC 50504]XP_059599539.1 uncharacterized protein EHEL_111955 [Encephalitozoon hellem ATCC 50504]UTX43652.1 hypothetical protein GPU96_07g14160 [Encephalitozoon hellem]AHL28954.1 hypothetical protein EHEL_071785 [Encephalitozoon hellem ATCC 50504]AHL28970.1 hypothetical protein EHEL_100065 [Encephalitozoon hellem ATCC 50504]AHL28981.1 hypothetica
MVLFPSIDGSSMITALHTLSIGLLVSVVVIAAVKTFPRLMSGRKARSDGTVEERIDKSFTKTESKIK